MYIYFSSLLGMSSSEVVSEVVSVLEKRCDSRKGLSSKVSDIKGDIPIIMSNLSELHKKDSRHDVHMFIDKYGGYKYSFHFPITDDEFDKGRLLYDESCAKYGRSSYSRLPEFIYNALHDVVELRYGWIDMELAKSYQSYPNVSCNKNLRSLEFGRVKR